MKGIILDVTKYKMLTTNICEYKFSSPTEGCSFQLQQKRMNLADEGWMDRFKGIRLVSFIGRSPMPGMGPLDTPSGFLEFKIILYCSFSWLSPAPCLPPAGQCLEVLADALFLRVCDSQRGHTAVSHSQYYGSGGR